MSERIPCEKIAGGPAIADADVEDHRDRDAIVPARLPVSIPVGIARDEAIDALLALRGAGSPPTLISIRRLATKPIISGRESAPLSC